MKIKSDMKKNYLKCYNEAKGVAVNKKRIIKNKTAKVPTYFQTVLITIILHIIFIIIFLLIDKSNIMATIFITLLILYILYAILRTIWSYNFKKKKEFINSIIIDEKGLTDSSFYNITINLNWSKLKAVVVKKHTITILTDTNLYFFFDIKEKEEIYKAIKKYNNNITIIEEDKNNEKNN